MSNMTKIARGARPPPESFKIKGQVGERGKPNTSTQPSAVGGGNLRGHNGKGHHK